MPQRQPARSAVPRNAPESHPLWVGSLGEPEGSRAWAPALPHLTLAPRAQRAPALGANALLAAMPDSDRERWRPMLELVALPQGQVLYEAGRPCSHAVFPTTAIVSLLNTTQSGASAEIAIVGHDGVVGLPLLTGGSSTTGSAVVQSAGHGFKLRGALLEAEFERGGPVMRLLLHYTQTLLTQMAQTASCNRHHAVHQQVCRLLLMSLDRAESSTLRMTQEALAARLGVRRESVTAVATVLQREGLIRYARGQVEVLDREGLEDRACECYGVVRTECERLLPPRLASENGPHSVPMRPACRPAEHGTLRPCFAT